MEKKYQAAINVDNHPFVLVGKIDRIDLHESHGYRIIDYKTGETAYEPDKTHRTSSGQWIDLQLPLYQLLVQSDQLIDDQMNIQLGYVHLPKDPADIGFAKADWNERDLTNAREKAMEVIRLIKSGQFWPPGPPAQYLDGLEGICLDPCIERNRIVHQVGLKIQAADQESDQEMEQDE